MRSKLIIALILGLIVGISLPALADQSVQQQNYCDSVEQDIMQNKSFEGTVDCFDPSEVDTELPDRINQSAELRCVCRKSTNGSVQWLNIAVSN